MSKVRKLIVNADDFGITKSVSDAIIKVFTNGSVSSTSMMVNMPGTDYAIDLAKQNPKLGIGLHFNISEGRSMLEGSSSLTSNEGYFYSRSVQLKRLLFGSVDIGDVVAELEGQYNYLSNAGLTITHIDSHQHLHMNPKIFRLVAEFADRNNLKVRIAYPHVINRVAGGIDWKKRLKQMLLDRVSRRDKKIADSLNITTNGSFNSIFDFHPFKMPCRDDYKALVESAGSDVHELMVHPYVISSELDLIYEGDQREQKQAFFEKAETEFKVLSGFSIGDWLNESSDSISLSTFGEL